MPGDWSATLTEPAASADECTDASCAVCQVKEAGARVIAARGGNDYDLFDPDTQAHFRDLAGEVLAVMSDVMLETGLVQPKEPV